MRRLPAKGTRDFLPDALSFRLKILESICKIYRRAGFRQIETPCIEDLELLLNNQGGENAKMVYKILKRGEKLNTSLETKKPLADLGLRFDLTLPLCRFYANNQNELPKPAKLIQIGQVWRAERPQHGRFRQFLQCDIDIIGLEAPFAELDLIATTSAALLNLGLKDFTVYINDRAVLNLLLKQCGFDAKSQAQVLISLDKLDKITWTGVRRELLNANQPLEAIDKLHISLENPFNFDEVMHLLKHDNTTTIQKNIKLILDTFATSKHFKVQFDLSLVRGMGYYTGLIFEIRTADQRNSIAGGGRYDTLIGNILNRKENVLAAGFSIGIERLINLLQQNQKLTSQSNKNLALLYDSETNAPELIKKSQDLRQSYDEVSLLPVKPKLARQLTRLVRDQFTHYALFKSGSDCEIKPLKT